MAVVYAYVGLTYLVFQTEIFESILAFFYFVFSCAGVIWFLLRYKKILSPPQQ